jgi:hypothetical protein
LPAPPKGEGFAASPLGLLPNNEVPLPKGEDDAASALGLLRLLPPKALPPPNRPPAGLLAAGAPKTLDEPVLEPPPNKPAPLVGVVAPELAVPKRPGADPPDVLLTAPNNGLFALPLFCCPKLPKPDMLCGVRRGDGSWVVLCKLRAEAVYTGLEEQRLRSGGEQRALGLTGCKCGKRKHNRPKRATTAVLTSFTAFTSRPCRGSRKCSMGRFGELLFPDMSSRPPVPAIAASRALARRRHVRGRYLYCL